MSTWGVVLLILALLLAIAVFVMSILALMKKSSAHGSQGPQGRQGQLGPQGRIGSGAQGVQGWQGIEGVQGTGPQGFQGRGAQGFQGWQGVQGTGPQGFQGLRGAQGAQGWQGSQGWQGLRGPQGTGTNPGVQGPQGWQGPQNPSIPSEVGRISVTYVPNAPNDVIFESTNSVNYNIISDPVSQESNITVECSTLLVTRNAGPMTDLTFSFNLPQSIIGNFINGNLTFIGNGTAQGTASPGPVAILQAPSVFINPPNSTFVLHYSFGGGTVPPGQTIQFNFYLSFRKI